MAMEKLGVERGDLLEGLRQEYQQLKIREAELVKTAGAATTDVIARIQAVAAEIKALETIY